jgi:hypothetical protein
MSNEIARYNPDMVQLFGVLPRLKTGGIAPDGHSDRCATTHQWLACTNLTFTDTINWTNMGNTDGGLLSAAIITNVPGDGIPDQVYGTFARPVSYIDAYWLNYASGNFASGYLAGQAVQPAIDEGYWLRCYLTNNLQYRQGRYTNTTTGHIITSGWLNYATVTATNNSVVFAADTSSIAGLDYRWGYHNTELGLFSPNFVTAEGDWMRLLIANAYKSYGLEDAAGQGTYRRVLFPGFAPRPLALVSGWSLGANSSQFFWMATAADNTVADALRSSAVRYSGFIPFDCPIAGDLTLPFKVSAIYPPPRRMTITTATVQ